MTQDEIEARGEFTPRTQGEIDRNLFAARTGGLVSVGPNAFWEMYYAAQAWHRHVKSSLPDQRKAREEKAGGDESARILQGARDVTGGEDLGTQVAKARAAGRYVVPTEDLAALGGEASPDDPFGLYPSPLAPQARDTQGDEPCAT